MLRRRVPRKTWSLRSKILLIVLALTLIPLSLQGVATYVDFSDSTERRAADYTVQLVGQMNRNLDRTLMETQRLSLMPLYDSGVLAILRKYSDASMAAAGQPTVDERSKMQLYIASMTFDRPEIDSIQLFAQNGYVFSSQAPSAIAAFTDVKSQSWYARVAEADGAWVLLPPHHPSYYLDDNRSFFSVARLIREPNTNLMLGVVKIDLKLDLFRTVVENIKFEESGGLVVQNSRGELFYGETAHGAPLEKVRPATSGETSVRRLELNGGEYLVISDYSSYSDLSFTSYIPLRSLLAETEELRDFTLLVGAVCLLSAGGLATFFSYRLTRPLGTLMKKMRLVERGDFKQSVPVVSGDEIGRLSAGFNRMVEEIDRLVHEVYVLGIREKEAELAALQSQINPHFIYNTLESISMLARSKQSEDISEMATSLGRLIRGAVDQDRRFIPLEEELEDARSYIRIQSMRLGPRLRTVFDVEEGIDSCLVPKLMLQPLIENAIVHGIGDRENGGTIWISAVRFEQDLLLTVRDDGRGLDERELAALRARLLEPAAVRSPGTVRDSGTLRESEILRGGWMQRESEVRLDGGTLRESEILRDGGPLWESEVLRENGSGVALKNIQQRLVLMFGEEYGLEVDGSPGQGAAFTLMIPIGYKAAEQPRLE
ncbi:sensor histidine kinase [Paenibacillus sp. CN-4]|uniref:cache domain-containing sensor histidine kinase n=1 Tax=Paenibacillus nanchangensis TaxID=3348343 RepID=UPI00397B103D